MAPPLPYRPIIPIPIVGIRQGQNLNNIVEQDHRAVQRITRLMVGFKSFEAARGTLAGVERMHMSKKRQLRVEAGLQHLNSNGHL